MMNDLPEKTKYWIRHTHFDSVREWFVGHDMKAALMSGQGYKNRKKQGLVQLITKAPGQSTEYLTIYEEIGK